MLFGLIGFYRKARSGIVRLRERAVAEPDGVQRVLKEAELRATAAKKMARNWEEKKDYLGTYRERSPLSWSTLSYESEYLNHCGAERRGKDDPAREFLPNYANCRKFIDAELIAQGMAPFSPETAAFRAGKLMLTEIDLLAQRRADFGFETTLSGRSYLRLIGRLRNQGYAVRIFFLCLSCRARQNSGRGIAGLRACSRIPPRDNCWSSVCAVLPTPLTDRRLVYGRRQGVTQPTSAFKIPIPRANPVKRGGAAPE